MAENKNGIIFLASVLSKMSQMFSDINSIYLQALANNSSVALTPDFNINSLFHQAQHHSQGGEFEDLEDLLDSEGSNNKDTEGQQLKVKDKKLKKERKKRQSKPQPQPQKDLIEPPHPPPSSYLLFFNDHRSSIVQKFPNLSVIQLNKIASKCWKQLDEEQKKPYHDRFDEEKQKYYQALKVYNQRKKSLDCTDKSKGGKQRGGKEREKLAVCEKDKKSLSIPRSAFDEEVSSSL